MKKLSIDLKNCYGIESLKHTFEYKPGHRSTIIYAGNGVMKTSFSKTFEDLSNNDESSDKVFTDRNTTRTIKVDGSDLESEKVFVIKPYDEDYKSNNVSTLVANKSLRDKYEQIHETINKEKESLLQEIIEKYFKKTKNISHDYITQEIAHSFAVHDGTDLLYVTLSRIKEEIQKPPDTDFSDIKYDEVFNDKTEEVLKDEKFLSSIKEYIEIYEELLEKSNFFKKGVFNHDQAEDVSKQLKRNGYFTAGHKLKVKVKDEEREINDAQELESLITEEKEEILKDEELKGKFDSINKLLARNADLKAFREYLENNQKLLPELSKPQNLRQKLWMTYFHLKENETIQFIETYKKGEHGLEIIREKAKEEQIKWAEVVEIFNRRFSVPFRVSISNQTGVICNGEDAVFSFTFEDEGRGVSKKIERAELLGVLSQGEKRALYLLNIIFEIESRRSSKLETFFIIDDIADSFDYKNKYAIIEYLSSIQREEFFFQIILSHNFDFYRTVAGRLSFQRDQRLYAKKIESSIVLEEEHYQKNPLITWKQKFLNNDCMLIALIPMARNILEYSKEDDHEDYKFFTSLLHYKKKNHDTSSITIKNVLDTLQKTISFSKDITENIDSHEGMNLKYLEFIYKAIESISDGDIDELESKVSLSIAIRLKAEEFVISELKSAGDYVEPEKNQTQKLIDKYKGSRKEGEDKKTVDILERVNLMVPENIHLNSFMYEPIIDMSGHHLKDLYEEITKLIK